MELHHQLLPRLAGEALLLGQGAMPHRRGSVSYRWHLVKRYALSHSVAGYGL